MLPDETPSGAQGWFINTRRDKFKDPRVREALIYAFDFEWTNKTIMYGAYARTQSPFQNSDMMANGPPSPEELALLEPFRGQVPDEVFGEPFVPPVSDGSGQDRTLLRKAAQLLQDAGFHQGRQAGTAERRGVHDRIPDRRAVDRAASRPFIKNLGTLGIEASMPLGRCRAVSRPGRGFRFRYDDRALQHVVDSGRRNAAVSSPRSRGHQGILQSGRYRNPVIDALIDKIIGADNREDLTIACRAFDRVFRAGRYWVPQWYATRTRSPIGTCSSIRRICRATRKASARRTIGGSIAAKAAKLEQAK